MDDDGAEWAQLELEQELSRADPAFDGWLDQLELKPEKENDDGLERTRL